MKLALALLIALPLLAQAPDLQPPADAERLPSGLATARLAAGTGSAHPADDSILRMRYSLWNAAGKLVSEVAAPREVMLPMIKMIPGWREGARLMVEGEKRRMWVSEALGAKGGPVVIDTELLEIIPGPRTPEDVAAPPADATVRKSGLAYKVLRAGHSKKHPDPASRVRVHYSGWTTDGKLFDSSVARGEPAELPLSGVIRGWQEVLQQMVEGDRVRVWIPEALAYRGERGKPKGMLVFDIDLLEVE
jgi:FKBP-type peptidyl-prolyl cis-trans isomerase